MDKIRDAGEAQAWADRLLTESEKRIEEWREHAARPATIAVSSEEAQKTHAVMLSVLELMRVHRESLLHAVRANGEADRRESGHWGQTQGPP